MTQISDKLQSFHHNYFSAKEMISSSEGSATKTVQFLPVFRRLFPATEVEKFNTNKKSLEQSESSRYCFAQCPRNDSQNKCISACKQFFIDSLTNGHQLIRKIHKEYKIPVIDDQDEE